MKKVLVTGGCGFVGSNLTARLLKTGVNVTVLDNLSRHGTADNLRWLQEQGPVHFISGDVRFPGIMDEAVKEVKPTAIFHLAGQVAMTTSINNPRLDFETNVVGSVNLLEAVRQHCPEAVIVYASSNKVYGELAGLELREEAVRYVTPTHPAGIAENFPLDFQTPYGCSKGAADQYMLDYARVYGLNTIVFRHSTIYGGRQYATFDQGWIGWFCQQALASQAQPGREPFTIAGNGKQVRDLLYVDDAVDCYLKGAENISSARGHAFNIGGGMENSCSILELFQILEKYLDIKLNYKNLPWRPHDQKFFVADLAKAINLLQWKPAVSRMAGIEKNARLGPTDFGVLIWFNDLIERTKTAAMKPKVVVPFLCFSGLLLIILMPLVAWLMPPAPSETKPEWLARRQGLRNDVVADRLVATLLPAPSTRWGPTRSQEIGRGVWYADGVVGVDLDSREVVVPFKVVFVPTASRPLYAIVGARKEGDAKAALRAAGIQP